MNFKRISTTIKPILISTCASIFILSCNLSKRSQNHNATIRAVNSGIDNISNDLNISVLDTHSPFLINGTQEIDESLYYIDGLHLLQPGYYKWIVTVIEPFLLTQNMENKTIAFVGDSITFQIDKLEFGNRSEISNWEFLLNVPSYNYGIEKNTTSDVIKRLNSIKKSKADFYFLLIGINDIRDNIRADLIINNIRYIVKQLQEDGSTVVLQYIMPVEI